MAIGKYTVTKFTENSNVRLKDENGKFRTAMFNDSIGKINILEGELEPGDYAVVGSLESQTRLHLELYKIIQVTNKFAEVYFFDENNTSKFRRTKKVTKNVILRISLEEKERLEAILIPYKAAEKKEMDRLWKEIENGKYKINLFANGNTIGIDVK